MLQHLIQSSKYHFPPQVSKKAEHYWIVSLVVCSIRSDLDISQTFVAVVPPQPGSADHAPGTSVALQIPPVPGPFSLGLGMIGLHPMIQLAWGPYSAHLGPNRAAQLQRYRYKRMIRQQTRGERRIRYQCRKQLADARPRVKGRFAKIHGPDGLLAAQQRSPDESGVRGRAAMRDGR